MAMMSSSALSRSLMPASKLCAAKYIQLQMCRICGIDLQARASTRRPEEVSSAGGVRVSPGLGRPAGLFREARPPTFLSVAVADGRTLPTDIEPAPWPCPAKVDELCRRTICFGPGKAQSKACCHLDLHVS